MKTSIKKESYRSIKKDLGAKTLVNQALCNSQWNVDSLHMIFIRTHNPRVNAKANISVRSYNNE